MHETREPTTDDLMTLSAQETCGSLVGYHIACKCGELARPHWELHDVRPGCRHRSIYATCPSCAKRYGIVMGALHDE